MSDNEKRENLANARRKLKKFRDQQPTSPLNNVADIYSTNGTSNNDSMINYNTIPSTGSDFVSEQPFVLNGFHQSPAKSPVINSEAPFRLSDQPRVNSGNNTSDRMSVDPEAKLRRDMEHLQEQLEIHVQTIGVLVAEKADISAKLTQSFKQLERKQSEMDELYGRLKASRERVQELEKEIQNSTSNVQKREMAAKESDKENDRLKIENIRQSQFIEDLKQTVNQLNDQLRHRQMTIDQLTSELEQSRKSPNEISSHDELVASVNRLRSDNEQYQKYQNDMQQHIQQLTNQINHLNESNHFYQTELETLKNTQTSEQETVKSQLDQPTKSASDELLEENRQLKLRIEQLEHTIQQLQNETETIGDYIQLYQQQREQLQRRYQEKDELIRQLTHDREHFQKKLLELFPMNSTESIESSDEQQNRILTLIEELSVKKVSVDNSSRIQLAFVNDNFYICSTCSGSVKHV